MVNVLQRVMLVVLVSGLVVACQDPVQPGELTQDGRIVVKVQSPSDDPLEGAQVYWRRRTGVGSPSAGGTQTGGDGIALVEVPSASINRDTVDLSVQSPPLPAYAGYPVFTARLPICSDTTLQFAFDTVRPCEQLGYADTIEVKLCPETGGGSASFCKLYPTTCASTLVATLSDSGDQEFSYSTRTVGTPASAVEVCATFTPAATVSGYTAARTVTVLAVDAVTGRQSYGARLTIIGRVECEECDCPQGGTVVDTLDTLCVGETNQLVAQVDSVVNTQDVDPACQIIATATRGPKTPGLLLLDQVLRTTGKAAFPDPRFVFSPTTTGSYADTIVYRLEVQRGVSGVVKSCPDSLRVIVRGFVGTPQCTVIVNNDTLRKCLYQINSTEAYVTIRNSGPCPVAVTTTVSPSNWFAIALVDGAPIPSPATLNIPAAPSQTQPYEQRFRIVTTVTPDQWDRNPNPSFGPDSSKIFTGTIRITGCGGQATDIPVVAVIRKECRAFTYQCMRQFQPPNYPTVYAESIRLLENEARIEYMNDNQQFRVFDIYVDSIYSSAGGDRIDLASGVDPSTNISLGGFFKVASNFYVPPGQNICTTNPVAAETACDQVRMNPGLLVNPITDLQVGDVILFFKSAGQACALIWIQEIGPDRTGGPSLNKSCLEICYPVFMP